MTNTPNFIPFSKPLVLIVEDDDVLLAIFMEMIAELGLEVKGVATADAGLCAFEQSEDIGLLLTDVKTPGRLSGWDLAGTAYRLRPNTPIIIMSGYSYEPGAQIPPNATFIQKPCSIDTLCCLVKERLAYC